MITPSSRIGALCALVGAAAVAAAYAEDVLDGTGSMSAPTPSVRSYDAAAASADAQQTYRTFPGAHLEGGRHVWLETCKVCHTDDFAGAPLVTDKAAWAERIRKGREVLYQHALEGFYGEDGAEMPPRGGDAALTDEQVKAAVDYMLALVSQ